MTAMTNTSKASELDVSRLRGALNHICKAYVALYEAAFADDVELFGDDPTDEQNRQVERWDDIYHRLTEDASFEQRLTRGQ